MVFSLSTSSSHPPRSHPHSHRPSSVSRSAASSNSAPTISTASSLFLNNVRLGSSVGDRIPDIIPGFRTSAAFISSLSANLRISDDDLIPSPISTPPSLRASIDPSGIPPPSPLTAAMSSAGDIDSASSSPVHVSNPNIAEQEAEDPLPPLATYPATSEEDRLAALKLVTDSVAQQRQFASRILISHPLNLSTFVLVAAVVAQLLYKSRSDLPLIFTTWAGVSMAFLVAVRTVTAPYLAQAENLGGWNWLGDDTVLVTKFGDAIIGAVVLGWEGGAEKTRSRKKKGGKGVIRAWTVRLQYRGKGEGVALLDEAVKLVHQKGGEGIIFDEDNPYSHRVLPKLYNGPFDKRDFKARAALEEAVAQRGSFGKKR